MIIHCIVLKSLVNKVPPHWHETHTEYLRVSSGKAYVVVDGVKSIIDSHSGEICVPIGVVHEWGVADDHSDEELVMWERTEPTDGEKEVFFRNMISSLIDSSIGNPFSSANTSRRPSIRDVFRLLVIVRALDNYPVIWNGFGGRFLTYSLLNIGNFIGKVFFGLKPFYMEYTPQQLWDKHKQKLD